MRDNLGVTWNILLDHLDALGEALQDVLAIVDAEELERRRGAGGRPLLRETVDQLETRWKA